MKATENLIYCLKAGYPYFYVQTIEIQKTVDTIVEAVDNADIGFKLVVWDFEKNPDPEEVLNLMQAEEKVLVIAKNWNWFLESNIEGIKKDFITILQNNVEIFSSKDFRRGLVIVSDSSIGESIPSMLVNDFMPLEFDRPDAEEIKSILDFIIESAKVNDRFEMPDEATIEALVNAAKGMTAREIKAAYAYSLVKTTGKLDPQIVAIQRAKEVEKTDGLKLGVYEESFDDLIGYDVAKKFAALNIKSPLAKGMLLVGPPGTGKTTFARSLANTFGMVCLEMEMAELFGGIVGETEAKVRMALDILRANAPCVWFIDEIEKGLAGVGGNSSGNVSTSGSEVTARAMAQVLKFMSHNRPEGIYCVATSNDATSLPPEWVRPGRWDSAPWYVDLPKPETKKGIFSHYMEKGFKLSEGSDEVGYPTGEMPSDTETKEWSGAEIETVCRLSVQMKMDIQDCMQFIRPVAVTMAGRIQALKKWAIEENRCIQAEAENEKDSVKIDRDIDF